MQFYDFEWFSWFPIIPVTNFQFVTNISGDMIEMRKKIKTLICFWITFFKGCNVFPQCNSMIFEWFSWFPIIPVTNFQFVTNISGDMIENQIKHLYASESLFKGCNVFPRNAILWFLSGLDDSLSFLLLIFNLWLTFQEIWSKWGKSNKTLICFWITFQRL